MAELTDEQIEAAAKVLARYSDTPWAMLPETSKMKARTVAGEIIRAALSTLPSATGAEDAIDMQQFANAVRDGIADHLADTLPDRKHALHEIESAVRSVEIRADLVIERRLGRTQPNGAAGGGETV